MSLNHFIISGRLSSDPELRFTQAQLPVLNFSIAHNEWSSKSGETTSWFNIIAFDKLAEALKGRLKRGDNVCVMGKLKIRAYKTKDGAERKNAEVTAFQVQLLGSLPKESSGGSSLDSNVDSIFKEDDIPF